MGALLTRADGPLIVLLAEPDAAVEFLSIPGAFGCIPRSSPVIECRVALDEVLAGRRYVSSAFAASPGPRSWVGGRPPTGQQLTVLRLKGLRMSNREVARELGCSVKVVEHHVTALRAGFGITEPDLRAAWVELAAIFRC